MLNIFKYLRNSGITVSINVNPFHWYYLPKVYKKIDPWNDNTYIVSFLFVHVSVFISNGDW